MPYIGNTIRAADDYRLIDDISSSFNGSTTSFALQVAGSAPVPFPKSPQQVLISVNGVIQEPDPTGASGFNLVGTNIVFSSAPTNGHAFFGIIYATADYLNAGGNFPSGSLGAPSFTFIGDENTGLYRKSGGSVGFVSDATEIANFDSNGITISSGNLILGDSSGSSDDRIKLGASGDLQIFHSGSQSEINSITGGLVIKDTGGFMRIRSNELKIQSTSNETYIEADSNGAVQLFFDDAKKAETVTGGFTVTGVCTATSFAGDGSSLSGIATDLVNDTSPQLGGDLSSNGNNITLDDNDQLRLGNATGGDIVIKHTTSDNDGHIENHTGDLFISTKGAADDVIIQAVDDILLQPQGSEDGIKVIGNGAVELYHDNTLRAYTTNVGLHVDTIVSVPDNGKFRCGNGDDLEIYHDGSNSYIKDQGTGNLKVVASVFQVRNAADNETMIEAHDNGQVELYHNDTKVLNTSNGGVTITGNLLPEANNTRDLGSTSLRWANIYTNDLNLSNEGSSNDVDSTWGNYTIQEGHEDLFLINNRTGKKFKFNLTEVS